MAFISSKAFSACSRSSLHEARGMLSCKPTVLPEEDRKFPSLVAWVLPICEGDRRAKTEVCSQHALHGGGRGVLAGYTR